MTGGNRIIIRFGFDLDQQRDTGRDHAQKPGQGYGRLAGAKQRELCQIRIVAMIDMSARLREPIQLKIMEDERGPFTAALNIAFDAKARLYGALCPL